MRKPNLVPNAVTDLSNTNFQNQKQNHVKRKILIILTEIYQKILFFAKVITKKTEIFRTVMPKNSQNRVSEIFEV